MLATGGDAASAAAERKKLASSEFKRVMGMSWKT